MPGGRPLTGSANGTVPRDRLGRRRPGSAAGLRFAATVGLLVALCLAVVVFLQGTGAGHADRTYTVAELHEALARDLGAWLGQTVQVRGVAACCFLWSDPRAGLPCLAAEEEPFDPCPPNVAVPLRTVTSGRSTLVALARGVPLLGPLIPAHAPLRWGVVTTYRVRLRAAAATDCGDRPCYEALLDAAP
jgi:hypothetical protein